MVNSFSSIRVKVAFADALDQNWTCGSDLKTKYGPFVSSSLKDKKFFVSDDCPFSHLKNGRLRLGYTGTESATNTPEFSNFGGFGTILFSLPKWAKIR